MNRKVLVEFWYGMEEDYRVDPDAGREWFWWQEYFKVGHITDVQPNWQPVRQRVPNFVENAQGRFAFTAKIPAAAGNRSKEAFWVSPTEELFCRMSADGQWSYDRNDITLPWRFVEKICQLTNDFEWGEWKTLYLQFFTETRGEFCWLGVEAIGAYWDYNCEQMARVFQALVDEILEERKLTHA